MDLESELLDIFGGHEILMANGQWELLVGLKLSKPGGIGVGGSARFSIEIVCEYVDELLPVIIVVGTRWPRQGGRTVLHTRMFPT